MVDTRKIGFDKEKEAVKFLKRSGYKIIETNFTTVFGEIDIIAKHKDDLVFVEVKYRNTLSGGTPQEAVTKTKQQKIIKSAILYLKQKNLKSNLRFDIVAITGDRFEIIESAFSSNKYYI
ncbi:MAG: YraN family protein [Endomicrobia bacterium]|nr:YraN family protein [Endomicrobiia bacterium]